MSTIDLQFETDGKIDYTYPPNRPDDSVLDMLAEAFCTLDDKYAWRKDFSFISKLSYRNNMVEAILRHLKGEVSAYSIRANCCEWLLSSYADLQDDYKKELKDIFSLTLETCASRSPDTYLDYLSRTQQLFSCLVPKEDQIKRNAKCLSQVRGRIKHDDMDWRFADYQKVVEQLGHEGEVERCLTTLLMAFRQLKAGSADSSVQVSWGMCMSDAMQTSNHESAFNWLLANWLPSQCSSSPYSSINNRPTMLNLCEALSRYCVGSLQLKKGEKSSGKGYRANQCKEQNPFWRRGLLNALAELELDSDKKAHRVAHFVSSEDFDDETRQTASDAYNKLIENGRRESTFGEMHRNYLAALWWLRIARADSQGVEIDMQLAKRWRRRELRHVKI